MTTPESLHAEYCRITNQDIALDQFRINCWMVWINYGKHRASGQPFNADDLVTVVRELQAQIKIGKRKLGALRFRNLIQYVDYFDEELAMIRAKQRTPTVPRGRAAVLRATGRVETPNQQDPQKVSEVLHRLAKEWRQQQGIV